MQNVNLTKLQTMLILHKTVADDVNLHKTVADDVNLTKIIADDVNFTQNSCRRC